MKQSSRLVTKFVPATLAFLFALMSVNAQIREDPPAVKEILSFKPGLQITRDTLIKRLLEADKTLIFKEGNEINNLPYYSATTLTNSTIQLIGKPNELIMAKWRFAFTPDEKINMGEFEKIAWFTLMIGEKRCLDWYLASFVEINKNLAKLYSDEKELYANRIAKLVYDPQGKTLTVTFKTL